MRSHRIYFTLLKIKLSAELTSIDITKINIFINNLSGRKRAGIEPTRESPSSGRPGLAKGGKDPSLPPARSAGRAAVCGGGGTGPPCSLKRRLSPRPSTLAHRLPAAQGRVLCRAIREVCDGRVGAMQTAAAGPSGGQPASSTPHSASWWLAVAQAGSPHFSRSFTQWPDRVL